MGFRDVGRVLWRGRFLVLAGLLLGAGPGVALAVLAAPVYQAGVSLRVEEQRARLPGFEAVPPDPQSNLVETEMEELRTLSLAEEVVEELGLQVRVAAPPGAFRPGVLRSAAAPPGAGPAEYVLKPAPGGRVAVEHAGTGRRLGPAAPGARVALDDGVVVALSPRALEHGQVLLEVRSRAEAAEELLEGLSVSRPNEQADVVRVAYEAGDPYLARDVANTLAARFLARRQRTAAEEADRALRLLGRQLATDAQQPSAPGGDARGALQARLLEARAAAALLGPGARVIDPARLPRTAIRPRRGLIVGLATVAGLVLGVVAALARAQLDRSVRTRAELLRATQLPVLGVVPRVRGGRRKPFRAVAPWAADGRKPRSDLAGTGVRVAEAFRAIRATACAAARRRGAGLVTVVVAGPAAGEGKTTSAANLAFVAAREGQRVLLVDADPGGGLSGLMYAAGVPGFHDVLWGTVSLEEAVRRVEPAGGGALHFLPGGAPPGPGGLPGRAEIARVLGAVRQGYDLVVVDSPGLGASLDAALLGAQADGVILVARAGRTRSDALQRAVETLQAVDAPLLGVVLNDANPGDA
jgi:capsular exopolysaccharide synthesis family protein